MATQKKQNIRIGIDGGAYNPNSGVKSGIERLLAGFMGESANLKTDRKQLYFYGFSAKSIAAESNIKLRLLPKKLFSVFFLPVRMIIDRVQVYLGFSGVIPPFLRLLRTKAIVFIHDFAFLDHPENYADPGRMKWQTEYALYGADRIIVFSDYIKEQVYKRYPTLPREKVVRIYPGGDHLGAAGDATADTESPYFLYVGVIKPAKNILVLLSRFEKFIRLYRQTKVKLILTGPQEEAYFRSIKDTLVYQKLKDRVEFRRDVSDSDMALLYRKSLGVVNVSHEEGFCYPVLEALELGKPVVVNDIPLYKEFLAYYPQVKITKTENEFIESLKKLSENPHVTGPSGKTPFRWRNFALTLLNEIDALNQ